MLRGKVRRKTPSERTPLFLWKNVFALHVAYSKKTKGVSGLGQEGGPLVCVVGLWFRIIHINYRHEWTEWEKGLEGTRRPLP